MELRSRETDKSFDEQQQRSFALFVFVAVATALQRESTLAQETVNEH